MMDVSAVAAHLWVSCLPGSAQAWFAEQLGADPAAAAAWVAFLAAAHDIGKASPAFQAREAFRNPTPHGTISTVILRQRLASSPFGLTPDLADRFATVVGGHHGVFPGVLDVDNAEADRKQIGSGGWTSHQQVLLAEIANLHRVDHCQPPARLTNPGALWLAGFISVADWIGSNDAFFPYAGTAGQLPAGFASSTYHAHASRCAERALRALGWDAWPRESRPRAFSDLFPFPANDVQTKTIEVARAMHHPALVIIEAPMGEGKTEAALYLADHGNAALGMRGHYVALPTQATSNQMFSRVRDFLGHRYPDQAVNALLLHGHASLSSDFQALVTNERSFLQVLDIPEDHNQGFDGAQPGVVAAAWFTARKRGLLAPFGVGTIDQALLAVLQTKHFFVRMLGLAGKTVVFDEVHAYDTYMSVLLERLLGWLAALGCSVVLLSATLPSGRRNQLLRSYGGSYPDLPPAEPGGPAAYPCLTWRSDTASGTVPLRVSARSRKRVAVRWLRPDDQASGALGHALAQALQNGGCAAVVCNTVESAQRTYRLLQDWLQPDEVSLLHARFLYDDRAAREAATLLRFGKPGDGIARPRRAVLVATQVIEQSLDLDFDLMVSELAPVDLILQRSGRLHRHPRDGRPARLGEPQLWILAPAEQNGLPVFSGGVTHVYAEHVLLRSWLALRHRSSIAIPEDVSALIASVYDDSRDGSPADPAELSDRLRATWDALQAARKSHLRKAQDVMILPPDVPEDNFLFKWNRQLEEDDPRIHRDLQALTRLGEQTVTAICLTPAEITHLRPRAGDAPRRAAPLLRRSVALTDRRIVHDLARMEPPSSWKTTSLLRYCRLLELDATGEVTIGQRRLRIDPELGVTIRDSGDT